MQSQERPQLERLQDTRKQSRNQLSPPLPVDFIFTLLLQEPLDVRPSSISQGKPLRPEGLSDFAKIPLLISGSSKANPKLQP